MVGPVRVGVQEDVSRLDIAVDESRLVRGVQRGCDGRQELGGPFRGQRPFAVEYLQQVAAGDEPHGDEQLSAILVGLVDRDDVRVVDGGGRVGLGDEPLPELPVGG